MARNGSGIYNLPAGQPVVTGTTISSTTFNTLTADIATALTQSLSADGQTPVTANIPMNGKKLTGLGAATTAGDAISQGQSGASVSGISVGNSNNATSTVLDYYDEYSTALTIVGNATPGTGTYSSQTLDCHRVGNRIRGTCQIIWSGHTGTGNVQIAGFPAASAGVGGSLVGTTLVSSNTAPMMCSITSGTQSNNVTYFNGTTYVAQPMSASGSITFILDLRVA